MLFSIAGMGCGESTYAENQRLKEEINALSKKIQFIRTENGRLRELSGEALQIGFEVQIAAFKEFDLAVYSDELVRFHEKKEFEFNKYVLGQFSRYEDAVIFLQDVREMGIKDAFIAGIVDGKRSSLEEAKIAAEEYYGSVSELATEWGDP